MTEQTLAFHFTPVDGPRTTEAQENPHAKKTTFVPEAIEALKAVVGDAVQEIFLYANEHTVYVDRARIVEVCKALRDAGFTYLSELGGIDLFTETARYEVFYCLVDIEAGRRLRLKIRVDEDDLTVPTLTDVFPAANWNEREAWDMYGIRFEGHPDLRRMFMPEDFEYHPLRKEFPLLGVPGSLPLPPQTPEAGLTMDPFPAAHGSRPIKSFDEAASDFENE